MSMSFNINIISDWAKSRVAGHCLAMKWTEKSWLLIPRCLQKLSILEAFHIQPKFVDPRTTLSGFFTEKLFEFNYENAFEFIEMLRGLYEVATMTVQVQNKTDKVSQFQMIGQLADEWTA